MSTANLSSKLSYELPSHPIGEHREALLSKTNTLFQLISLNDMGIDFLPEIIILGNCRYRYAGVEYGRGIYRKEDEVPPVESPFLQPSEDWTNGKRDPVVQSPYTFFLCKSPTLEGYQQRFPYGQCDCVTTFHTPEDAIASGKTVLYGSVTADPRCSVCHGTGAMPAEPTPVPTLMHNDLHNPAYMQCGRCRILAEKLAEMLKNPPGFEGIKVDGEHYGNKYIDFGWRAAVRVVQSLIVPCGDGTTPETASSLVENPDVPQEKQ